VVSFIMNNLVIQQDSFEMKVSLIDSNYIRNPDPDISLQSLIDTGKIGMTWYLDGSQAGTDTTLSLDNNNNDQGKDVYLELTDTENNLSTSNTVTVSKVERVLYSFEGGITSDWTQTTNFNIQTNPARDSQSAGSWGGNTIDAILQPSLLSGGVQISRFRIYWQEDSSQTGFTFDLRDASGNTVLMLGGNNPQWEIEDGSGSNTIYNGDGYNRWIMYQIDFDWANGEHTYLYKDTSSGTTRYGTRFLLNATNIAELRINNSNGSWGNADYMVVDDIMFEK